MNHIRLGLTFADVLLVPKRSGLSSRSEADLKTRFTKNLDLNIPLVSSNMATVTESRMAIAMAREGGLGIVHQFNTIEEQAEEVRKVKKSTSFVVDNPVSVQKDASLGEALQLMQKENVTSVIVMDGEEISGILTSRDYMFENNMARKVADLMTPREKLVIGDYGMRLEEAKQLLNKHKIEKLPLLKNGKLKGLITNQDILKLEHWKDACRDEKGRLRVGAAVGVKDSLERATALVNVGCDVIVLDVAHAHSDMVIKKLKELKAGLKIDVMVGNIATAEAAAELIKAGADGLKVGIGPSPVCTTRLISGAGIPQLTAIMDVVEVARKHGVPVTADGGMKYPGDITKALAAGASSIYSGSLFSGTDEAPGFIIMKDGKRYKRYMGSASYDSGHERRESQERRKYKDKLDLFVEGISVLVDYKGPVEEVIHSLLKGVRSGVSYAGGRDLKELQQNAEFIQITPAAWDESKAHGVKLSE